MPKITVHGGPSIAGETGPELVNLSDGGQVVERPAGSPELVQVGGFLPPDGTERELPPVEHDTTEATSPDYESWTVEQLRDDLGNRELSKSGNKAELVARLVEHDEAKASE